MATFREKLKQASEKSNSLVCVGLDTDTSKIPQHFPASGEGVLRFNEAIIDSLSDLVCAFKPNTAFYEALGSIGIDVLQKTCQSIPHNIPIILDCKRGDIGHSAEKYAEFTYDFIGADAVTINPYIGFDSIKPFQREGKCVFVLCVTSNPSAKEIQMLDTGDGFLYERVARNAVKWSKEGDVGLVVGATKPETFHNLREIVGDMTILVPGVGTQGGDVKAVVSGCGGENGSTIINSSRAIIYASKGEDFQNAARHSLIKLRDEINKYRGNLV